jgi:LPS-assembly protein
MTPALAALVVLGQAGVVSAPLPTANEPIHVQADASKSDSDAEHITLSGHALLRTSGTLVKADTITLDQDTNLLIATGGAFCVSGFLGAVADQLTLDLNTGTVGMQAGHFFEKKKVTLERMLAVQTAAELQSVGQTALAGTADRIQRAAGGHLHMNGLTFTPCDCEPRDPLKPHWSIQSVYADVVVGEGAWLFLPIIRIYDAPVLALPLMYVPLSDRKTGLLPILPSYSALNGWTIPVPVYVTLGRSADIEMDLDYTFGGSAGALAGVKGPSLDTTFRFTPSLETHGTAELFLQDDTWQPRDPENGALWNPGTGPKHWGLRGELTSQIVSILGGGFTTRLDLNLASDAALTRDVATDVLVQANQYLTSTFQVSHRSADAWEGVTLSYRQDTQAPFGYSLFGNDRDPVTDQALRGPATLQQLPDIAVALPERPLWGPLFGSLDVDYTRLSPLTQLFGDEGRDGLFLPVAPGPNAFPRGYTTPPAVLDALQGDGIYQAAYEREARDRLDVVPRLVMTLPVGDFLRIRPQAWVRQDVYAGEMTGDVHQRGYAVVDLLVFSELSRTYGEGPGALRNAIQPSVELRDVVGAWGAVPGPQPGNKYDAIDWAIDTNQRLQGVVKLTELLTGRLNGQTVEFLRLDVAQEFLGSASNGLSDSVASARTTLGAFNAFATFRFDNQRHAPALFGIGAGFQPSVSFVKGAQPAKYSFHAEYDFVYLSNLYLNQNGIPFSDEDQQWVGGSSAQRRGIDALVGSPLPQDALQGSLLHTINLTAMVSFPYGLSLSYAGTLYPEAPPLPASFAATLAAYPGLIGTHPFFGQQQLTVGFAPACNCWQLTVGLRTAPGLPNSFPQVVVDFTVAGFGTFGN